MYLYLFRNLGKTYRVETSFTTKFNVSKFKPGNCGVIPYDFFDVRAILFILPVETVHEVILMAIAIGTEIY